MIITKKLRDAYVDDLRRARPQGPHGRRVTYTEESKYDYDKGKYKVLPIPSHKSWGYTDEEIFSLGLHTKDDVSDYVMSRWFQGKSKYSLGRKQATYTRRVNRIWDDRLSDIVDHVKKTGGTGIYSVTLGRSYYSGSQHVGHIYAADAPEAERFAEMFFSYLCDDGVKPRAQFVRFGQPEELIVLNAKTISAASDKIKAYQEKIAKIEELIEKQGLYLDTLHTVQAQQLNAES